jgi:phosphoglycolate phosphatase
MNGTLTTGAGDAAEFVAQVSDALAAELGFRPFHGTLNLQTGASLDEATVALEEFVDDHCDGVELSPCRIAGVRGAVIRPLVPGYPDDTVEIVAPVRLRSLFEVDEGDTVPVSADGEVWPPEDLSARPTSLSAFDAAVFDLDRTLLTLDVDWEDVFEEVQALLDPVTDRPVTEFSQNELYEHARRHDRYDDLEELLRTAELDGATQASPLPALDVLPELDCPVGVCTANAVSAAERALAAVGAREYVDAIVGRTTVEEQKPRARPLSECFDRLDANAGDGVFVGDRDTDAGAAVNAGASFLHPSQLFSEP